MLHKIIPLSLAAAVVTLSFSALAQTPPQSDAIKRITEGDTTAKKERACEWEDNVRLTVTTSGSKPTPKEAYAEVEQSFQKTENIGKQAKLATFELSEQQYSINKQSRNNGDGGREDYFSYNANSTFTLAPADRLDEILTTLESAGLNTRANVSRRKSCRN